MFGSCRLQEIQKKRGAGGEGGEGERGQQGRNLTTPAPDGWKKETANEIRMQEHEFSTDAPAGAAAAEADELRVVAVLFQLPVAAFY